MESTTYTRTASLFLVGTAFLWLSAEPLLGEVITDYKIRMRDGVKVSVDVYKPERIEKPVPAIVQLTTYSIHTMRADGEFWMKHGYAFIAAHPRGRGKSEGRWRPYEVSGRDGHDIIQHIARQPWCDGQVGMYGLSMGAFTQWQTLKHMPKSLKTVIPSSPSMPGLDTPNAANVFYSFKLQWLAAHREAEFDWSTVRDRRKWDALYRRFYTEHVPFAEWGRHAGLPAAWWKRWVEHPHMDDYWKSLSPTRKEYAKIDIPILSLTGYFDVSARTTALYRARHLAARPDRAADHHFMIGPWTHGEVRRNNSSHRHTFADPKLDPWEEQFGRQAVVAKDMLLLYGRWFDWVLKGKARAKIFEKPVSYFVLGENRWETADSLDELSDGELTLHLTPAGGMSEAPPDKGTVAYTYDPLDTSRKPIDESTSAAWVSEALDADVRVAGRIDFRPWIQLNVPDTDLIWYLSILGPAGERIHFGQGMMRARYREGAGKARLVTPGSVIRYDIPNLYSPIVRTVKKGSRFRLVLTCPNTPGLQKNYNSDRHPAQQTKAHARTATVTVHHGPKTPSALVMPVRR